MPPSFTHITVCPCDHWRVGVSGWIIQMIVNVIKAPWVLARGTWALAERTVRGVPLERPAPRHPRWCGWPARQRRARGGPRDARGTKTPRVLLRPQRCGSVGCLGDVVGAEPSGCPAVTRRGSPRRERGGPSVIRSGRDDRPWGARRGYCSPATSSVVPGGSIPSFYMIGSPGPQASRLEVRPVGPCRLEGKMARATRERDPHGYG